MNWLNRYLRFWSSNSIVLPLSWREVMSAQPKVAIKPSLTLKRRLNAAPEKVFAAWTDPEKIVKWFGPDAGRVKTRGARCQDRRPLRHRVLDGRRRGAPRERRLSRGDP